ncbi:CDP-alcohol phosphatidyltransferase family protein [Phytohabitans aurantiacus]|uniref:CDP-alcohol phosphatidyltransferase n=1 Tax=Phytohabitans aurantiacus TaxID=3016789 RepID=A0ABQ5R0E5_9ACTN|nr:CDP-alcohol phosphatidyltransferase family protein [Phytohabitans aurantiacus]GLH99889.1 hypothetical protein Pa4123_51650 [Phytohabitans aurantiacus]
MIDAVSAIRTPTAADYRRLARPAGLVTNLVSYPVASRLCVVAARFRIRPTAFTLANLVLGAGTSAAVIAAAPVLSGGGSAAVVAGVLAWLGWQIAYICDCVDGQLARGTKVISPAGGRLDVLCDITVQVGVVAAVAAVVQASTAVPGWVVAVFAATWMVNMVTSVMDKQGAGSSLVASRSVPVRLIKVVRDYGFMVTLIAVVLIVRPAAMVWVLGFFAVVNGAFLLISVAKEGVTAWREGPAR